MGKKENKEFIGMRRRDFLKGLAIAAASGPAILKAASTPLDQVLVVDDFQRANSLYHGDGWESLNPGYWKIENKALRRRLKNVGDRARDTGFPYHWETHQNKPMPMEYDPSLPFGMIWRRDWKLNGNYTIRMDATVRALRPGPVPEDDPTWQMHQPGYGLMGICFGGQSQFESWNGGINGSMMAIWRDDQTFGLFEHTSNEPGTAQKNSFTTSSALKPGDKLTLEVIISGRDKNYCTVTSNFITDSQTITVTCEDVDRNRFTEGYLGLVSRGMLDFEVNKVTLEANGQEQLNAPVNDCHVCYALGDTLEQVNGKWQVRFVGIFRNDGKLAEVRVSDMPDPDGGWKNIKVAGSGAILNNDFRRNTAVIDVILPFNPAEKALYYTVWKDGKDVTGDPRIGTASCGPGTGMVGDVPTRGAYVGRLPQLKAPYRLCGLSCHAIHENMTVLPHADTFEGYYVHDQPTFGGYQHLEDYDFQVMLWEDDVWYMELLIYPPSTDDAYKIVTTTIAGPTSRWQMMRHWNVLNPGDHDHGMDDVKGPEQIIIRNHNDLGQDPEYMQRNFQIVSHLMTGKENPSGTENPKRWRRWKMPEGDFSLVITDSRLWRSSQDTNIWDDEGWGHKENLYSRTDPTRSLLGEEQFAWLTQIIKTDSSPLICLTGINGLHTVWTGWKNAPQPFPEFGERDRVAADYAGWVKAGVDRVIKLLAGREGVVSVYGDVHSGCIMKNTHHRLYECSFGPNGRSGGRGLVEGFGPKMKDYDGRDLEVHALYHDVYESPNLKPLTGPFYWNFLEMNFDPREADPAIGFKIRNMIDPPVEKPRGGGFIEVKASVTGRHHHCKLPALKTLPNAHVRFAKKNAKPIRGVRSLPDGTVPVKGLIDIEPGTQVLMTSFDGKQADIQIIQTLRL